MRKKVYVFGFLILLFILSSCQNQISDSLGTLSDIEPTIEEKIKETLTISPLPTSIDMNESISIIPETSLTFSDLPPFEYGKLVKEDATATIEFYDYEGINNPDDIISYISSIKELGFNEDEFINSYDLNSEILFYGTNQDQYSIAVHLEGTNCLISFGLSIYE